MCFTLKLVFVSFYCPLSPTSLFNSSLSVISVIELILLKPISSPLFSSTFLSSLIPSIPHLPPQIQTLINSDWRREVRDITPHRRHIGVRITSFPNVNIQQSHWKLWVFLSFCVFQALIVASRSPEDPEILLLSGVDWSDETAELVQLDWTTSDWHQLDCDTGRVIRSAGLHIKHVCSVFCKCLVFLLLWQSPWEEFYMWIIQIRVCVCVCK